MKNDQTELFPAKKNNVALGKYENNQAESSFNLSHRFAINKSFQGIRSVNVTSDNRYLIITYENNDDKIRLLDLQKLEYLPIDYTGHTDSVRLTAICKDNKSFYTASWDGTSRKFDILTGNCSEIFGGFGRSPSCFLDTNQRYLFTASYDSDFDLESKNTGRCWDLNSGKTIHYYQHTDKRICPEAIDIVYNDGNVYTGSDDGVACKWNLIGDKPILKFFSFYGSVRKIAVSSKYFAAACTDGYIRIHSKFTGRIYKYLYYGETDVRDIRISTDETKIWGAAEDGTVSCFNMKTGELVYHKQIHTFWIWSICLMNDEKIVVTGSSDGSIAFLSADSGRILARLLNVPMSRDLLMTCPPDKTFPSGFFYTGNKYLIKVIEKDKRNSKWKELNLNDPRREVYINKLNLKNLVLMRLRNNNHYSVLTGQYLKNQKRLSRIPDKCSPKLLMS